MDQDKAHRERILEKTGLKSSVLEGAVVSFAASTGGERDRVSDGLEIKRANKLKGLTRS